MKYERVASCADRIKIAMEIRGVKQSDLCRLTKIPKSAMSQYLSEAYEPKQDRIYLISKALNVNEIWLMGLDAPMERQETATPDKVELTEGEQKWMELYQRLSPETRELLMNTMGSFDSLSKDKQNLALQLIRVALGGQE